MIPVYRATIIQNTPLTHVEAGQGRSLVSDSHADILSFLVTSSLSTSPLSSPRAVWSLSAFVDAVCHVLLPGTDVLLRVAPHRAQWYGAVGNVRYRLYLQPGKFFSVNVNHQETTFYGISDFFPDDVADPVTVRDLQSLADLLEASFQHLGVTRLTHLKSPVAVVEDAGLLDEAYDTLPTRDDVPVASREVLEYAQMCDGREWVDNYQVGDFPELWSYDMTAAYPYQAGMLPDLRTAAFLRLDGFRGLDFTDHWVLGFVKGDLFIEPEAFQSSVLSEVDGRRGSYAGKLKREIFTLDEVVWTEYARLGRFDFKDGWVIFGHKSCPAPLATVLFPWWQKRLDSPDDLTAFLVKRVMNGIIGRLGEWRKDGSGVWQPCRLANPIYRATILTNTSLRVAQALIDHHVTQSELVTINVDGFKTTRRLDIPAPSAPRMGAWREAGCEPTTVLSPNHRLIGEKREAFLSAAKRDPGQVTYGDIDLGNISTMQDRIYRKFPLTGREFLRGPYISEPVVVPDGAQTHYDSGSVPGRVK